MRYAPTFHYFFSVSTESTWIARTGLHRLKDRGYRINNEKRRKEEEVGKEKERKIKVNKSKNKIERGKKKKKERNPGNTATDGAGF